MTDPMTVHEPLGYPADRKCDHCTNRVESYIAICDACYRMEFETRHDYPRDTAPCYHTDCTRPECVTALLIIIEQDEAEILAEITAEGIACDHDYVAGCDMCDVRWDAEHGPF